MKRFCLCMMLVMLCTALTAHAQAVQQAESLTDVQKNIQQYLQSQPSYQQRDIKIIWPRRLPSLPPCAEPLSIRTEKRPESAGWLALSLKCQPGRWVRQLEVRVLVMQRHLVAAQNLPAGHVLTERDLRWVEADTALVGARAAHQLDQVLGQELRRPLPEGSPVRLNSLQEVTVITKGSMVTVIMKGTGFELETQGQAMGNAPLGGTLRVSIKEGIVLPTRVISSGLVLAQ
jgi:flagella basal body P-ring formation protein FlgA